MRPDIQAVVMSAGQPASRALAQWLSRQGIAWRYGSQDYGIDHARNQNVRRFLAEDAPRGKAFLLMVDHDMVPTPETVSILTTPGNLLYCGYADRYGTPGHYGDEAFGAACFRASAELLAAMPDPWFKMGYVDGRRVACECGFFRMRAKGLGYQSQMVGIIGHEQRCVLLPDEHGGYALHWPPEFEDGPST
jgi:hypothetical protein